MAFCESWGNQLSDTAKFCRACGNAAGALVASSPSTPSKKSNSPLKWIPGMLVVLLILAGLAAGAAFYFFHRVSKQAGAITQDLPDLSALSKVLPSPEAQPPPSQEPASLDPNKIVTPENGQCALFNKEELTRVLGTTFTHATADAMGCTYKGDAAREFVRTEALWAGGRKLVKQKNDAYANMRQSMVNQHYSKAEIDTHVFPISPYPGAGDEAWVDLVNIVTARKVDVGITMDLRYYHDSDAVTRLFVNTALARLSGGVTPVPATTAGTGSQ
jgi:hypothetical protein